MQTYYGHSRSVGFYLKKKKKNKAFAFFLGEYDIFRKYIVFTSQWTVGFQRKD